MLGRNTKEKTISIYSFKMVYKIMLIAGLLIACATAVLNYLFIQNLAESRIQQVKSLADTTSVFLSELVLSNIDEKNQQKLISSLNQATQEITTGGGNDLIQISVIRYPDGDYYASTNSEFVDKKVHQTLLNKIEENQGNKTVIEKLNFEFKDRTIPVLHYLRNIRESQQGEEKTIAVVQILFDYGTIISETRRVLLVVCGVFLACIIGFVWIMYLPVSRVNKKIISGFNEIRKNNFNVKLKTNDFGEVGILYNAFNNMTDHLVDFFHEKNRLKMNSVMSSIDNGAGGTKEFVLRKSEVTCLCARLPLIQETIETKSLEAFEEAISEFVEPFEIVVKEYGGQVIKILGNKTFVIYEGINSVDNAIRTALKINQKWQMINHERKVLSRQQYDFGIGLHSAESVAGIVGKSSSNYTIVGKAASLADYLCSCAKSEEILASSSLMDKAGGSFQHQVLTDLEPREIDESEQVLVLSNLHYNDDELTNNASKSNSIDLAGEFHGSDESVNDLRYDSSVPNVSAAANQETSIPDMLEETLSSAPLESVAPGRAIPEDSEELIDESRGDDLERKQSLWEEFDNKK